MNWYQNPAKPINHAVQAQALAHQNRLTKPTGSLGQMERIAVRLAGMQGRIKPDVCRPYVAIFAGDHGVMAEQVSAYPQVVTRQMLHNFATGGACVSVMAHHVGANLEVINCGVIGADDIQGVIHEPIAHGTKNFIQQPAMSANECTQALSIGKRSVERAVADGADIYVAGEMGIGNTCSASALACLVLGESAERMTGRGSGVNDDTLHKKTNVVAQAVAQYQKLDDPLAYLRSVGGFEMVAMVGAYIRAGQLGLPVVVDGFIASVSAQVAVHMNSSVADWLFFGHLSQEQAHHMILSDLNAEPILDLGLRLGEGSGAVASLTIIQLSCVMHDKMATFESAGVADKDAP
ncbi:MAG: nicotinate-nucleotide--dimethylbenzimidazole phosphoribosyltransferase [Moraxella sp.]|nr:nicotinate-nucleotide--dimethylbenzimidazole phosphoribosyltransferase [Moraxella sp.]